MSETRGRALVIDDDAQVRTLIADLLEVLRYQPDRAKDGPEGLALFEQRRYELVVTDLIMPGLTGWHVAETMRRNDPVIAIVIASGSVSDPETERLSNLRAVLITKPFTFAEFRKAIERALALARVGSGSQQEADHRPEDRRLAKGGIRAKGDRAGPSGPGTDRTPRGSPQTAAGIRGGDASAESSPGGR
jgi:CheY-like chemotaxis protein